MTMAPPATTNVYAAAVNPPRRAKTTLVTAQTPSTSVTPAPSTNDGCSETTNSLETSPNAGANIRKRRGRKAGAAGPYSTSSRAAREAARRESHSRIEKARRGKINDALDALRSMVPTEGERSSKPRANSQELDENSSGDDDYEETTKISTKRTKQPDFKLDVLERTVAFMHTLLKRVETLESEASERSSQTCPKCSIKRSRDHRKIDPVGTSGGGVHLSEEERAHAPSSGSLDKRASGGDTLDADEEGKNECGRMEGAVKRGRAVAEEHKMGESKRPRIALPSIASLLDFSPQPRPLPPSTEAAPFHHIHPQSYLPSPTLTPLISHTVGGSSSSISPYRIESSLPSPVRSVSSTRTSPTFTATSSYGCRTPSLHLPAPAMHIARRHSEDSSLRTPPVIEEEPGVDDTAMVLLEMRRRTASTSSLSSEKSASGLASEGVTPSSVLGMNVLPRRA